MKLIHTTRNESIIVDAADYLWLRQYRWSAVQIGRTKYAVTYRGKQKLYLHRLLTGVAPGVRVDHENNDGLDNRRSNLRPCTHAQNLANQRLSRANTLGYKGIRRNRQRWCAQAKVNQKVYHLGTFATKEDAARAYDAFMVQHYGPFAKTNRALGLLP